VNVSLPLNGEWPASEKRPRWAIAAKGFRPFFLLAASFALAIVPLWLLALLGVLDPGGYLGALDWHAHEMVFGFAVAVIAGFLLTAVGNWTQRETVVGAPLLALSGLWLVGRIAVIGPPLGPRVVTAVADLAFLPALIAIVVRPIVASGNRRNFAIVAILSLLFLANLAVHLDALGVLPGWRRRGTLFAVDVVVLLILIMAGRVFPMFTRNATGAQSIRSHRSLDALSIGAMALLALVDAALPAGAPAAIVAGLTGVFAAARAVHWGAWRSSRVPLLWILHVGYAWIPVALWLRAASAFTRGFPESIATHAFTVGAIGALTLGMMARVTLGHTGRALVPPRSVVVAFALIVLAATARVVAPLISPLHYRVWVIIAGTLWSAAFTLYLVAFAPALVSPRPDAKPG